MSIPPSTSAQADHADSTRWFMEQVHPHDAALKAYLRGAFPSVRAVDDVVQESYLRVWRNRAAQPIESAKAFLFTIARRLAIDLVRRARRAPFVDVKDLDGLFVLNTTADAYEAASRAQEIELLAAAIEALPSRCREIFILCHIDGHSQQEVARRLALSPNTVAVQSARGLQRCEKFVRQRLKTP